MLRIGQFESKKKNTKSETISHDLIKNILFDNNIINNINNNNIIIIIDIDIVLQEAVAVAQFEQIARRIARVWAPMPIAASTSIVGEIERERLHLKNTRCFLNENEKNIKEQLIAFAIWPLCCANYLYFLFLK